MIFSITDYTKKLMGRLFQEYCANPAALRSSIDHIREKVPKPLASKYEAVDKSKMIEDYESRFSDLTH